MPAYQLTVTNPRRPQSKPLRLTYSNPAASANAAVVLRRDGYVVELQPSVILDLGERATRHMAEITLGEAQSWD